MEALASHQVADQRVVPLGGGVEAIRPGRVVGMAVVGARDERDPETG